MKRSTVTFAKRWKWIKELKFSNVPLPSHPCHFSPISHLFTPEFATTQHWNKGHLYTAENGVAHLEEKTYTFA